ncbi:hypothetical protein BRC99_03120 [Halobacteriales archaeon QS_7_69_60]|nr:MAG: hypothetical protein BRC99_03120 [Halobacteriales archaeon QS_7_69_60]
MSEIELSEMSEVFEEELTFPATSEEVIDECGDTTLQASGGDGATVADLIERGETDEFESTEELVNTLMTFVDDDYVGRTGYSDRSDNSWQLRTPATSRRKTTAGARSVRRRTSTDGGPGPGLRPVGSNVGPGFEPLSRNRLPVVGAVGGDHERYGPCAARSASLASGYVRLPTRPPVPL